MSIKQPHEILQFQLEKLKDTKSSASIRWLASQIGVSHTFVVKILNGSKKVPNEKLILLLDKLSLSNEQKKEFYFSLLYYSLPNEEAKKHLTLEKMASEKLENGDKKQEFVVPDPSSYDILDKWFNIAILDLTLCSDFQPSISWISKRLKISEYLVSQSVGELFFFDLLKVQGDTWVKSSHHLNFPTSNSKLKIRNFHRQMIGQALEHLTHEKRNEFKKRLISGATIPCNSENILKAQNLLDKTLDQVIDILSEGSCDEVFQLNIQLFPLTQKVTTD